jgi:hypothetical protein
MRVAGPGGVIPPLAGWSFRTDARGATLVHPGGEARGVIRYLERCRPLAPLARIVVQALPHAAGAARGRPRRLITLEGEYGAVVALAGPSWFAAIGAVFLDDFFSLTLGLSRDRSLEPEVTALVARDAHALGVRRRWFLVRPPPGWRREPLGPFDAVVRGPSGERLFTFPALPRGGVRSAERLARAQLARLLGRPARLGVPARVTTARGLAGHRWEVRSARGVALFFVFEDARYAYPLAFVGEVRSRTVRAVCDSVEPLPGVAAISACG